MLRYILYRVAVMIPTLLIISALVFTIIELPPGDYFESYIAELQAQGENVNTEQIEALRKEYGFDKPVVVRYVYCSAACLPATSAIPSNINCRYRTWWATDCGSPCSSPSSPSYSRGS